MSILVLGADGYLGWALTSHLAMTVKEPILAVDDLSKRRRVAASGHESAIPVLPFNERIRQHNEWFPIERQLPMDPRTRDYVLIHGRSYRREPLGADWVLSEFPA